MSGKIKHSEPSESSARIAQDAVRHYWAIATSDDVTVSQYNNPIYRSARRHMLDVIAAAYGMTPAMAYRVYAVILDSGEWDNLARCVQWVVDHPGEVVSV